ncbi:MAG: twin-arginine translocation signal domain-containing protein [Candidatus Sericytochromatia bacterium]
MKEFSRRDLLKGLGSMGVLALASPITGLISACSPPATLTDSQTNSGVAIATSDSPDCNLTPEAVEGPYYIKASDLRQDITEGKVGVPMELLISVVNARTCLPIANATIDVWHADA